MEDPKTSQTSVSHFDWSRKKSSGQFVLTHVQQHTQAITALEHPQIITKVYVCAEVNHFFHRNCEYTSVEKQIRNCQTSFSTFRTVDQQSSLQNSSKTRYTRFFFLKKLDSYFKWKQQVSTWGMQSTTNFHLFGQTIIEKNSCFWTSER